jgi:lysophospholipase-2
MGMVMPSWYDIVGLDLRSNEVCNGLDDSVDRIMDLVEVEINVGNDDTTATSSSNKSSSLDYSRIVLAGFSQGGALALYAGMTQTGRRNTCDGDPRGPGFAGIVVMSGYLPRSNQLILSPGSENTPILHCHGEIDSVVSLQAAKLSKERISSLVKESGVGNGDTYELKTYRGLDHSVSMEELDDVASFLRRVIPPIYDAPSMDDLAKMSVRQLRDAIGKAGLAKQAKGMLEKSELVNLLSQHMKQSAK